MSHGSAGKEAVWSFHAVDIARRSCKNARNQRAAMLMVSYQMSCQLCTVACLPEDLVFCFKDLCALTVLLGLTQSNLGHSAAKAQSAD